MTTRHLLPFEIRKFEEHLLRLDRDARLMRFECATGDQAIRRYVAGIDVRRDAVFGHFDRGGVLRGAAHVAVAGDVADLGLSVERDHRGQGIGTALLDRATAWSRFTAKRMSSQCLTNNRWMMGRVESLGFAVERDSDTAVATLHLAPADLALAMDALLAEHAGWTSWGIGAAMRGIARGPFPAR